MDALLFGVPKPELLLDPKLRKIDQILDDESLVDEIFRVLRTRHRESARRGRMSTPAETVLRLLVLKHVRRWSYEQLEWEVTGNVAYRYFCRIDGGKVPDAKTMVRLGQLLDDSALQAVFDRVITLAKTSGATRGRKMRVDTTVVEAPIHYPTDSGLCADAVRVISRELEKIEDAGLELPFDRTDVRRSVARRLLEIGQALRRRGEAAKKALVKPYRRLLRTTGRLIRQATATILAAARRRRELPTDAVRHLSKLAAVLPLARRVVRQTRARILHGVTNSEDKLLSIFEPYAKILRRGKLHKSTEFGVLVKVQEADGGIVTDVSIAAGHHDSALLVPSVERHIAVFGRAPILAATDRGFFSAAGERRIHELGVRRPAIPHCGYKSRQRIAHERQRWFRRGRAWRAGGEARISRLKYGFGMARSRYQGELGMKRTVYWAAIANNLVVMSRMA